MKNLLTEETPEQTITINGVEITEKELRCLAARVQELFRMQIFKENEDVLFSHCLQCPHGDTCGSFDWFDPIKKLMNAVQIPVTRWVGKNGMYLPQKESNDRARNLLFFALTRQADLQDRLLQAFKREVETKTDGNVQRQRFDRRLLKDWERLSGITIRTAEELAKFKEV